MAIMNQLISAKMQEKIQNIEDRSSGLTDRMRVTFTNGYSISIVQGPYTYGAEQGYYEIALFDADDNMNGDLFDENDRGDDVLGFCNPQTVTHYINKLVSFPTQSAELGQTQNGQMTANPVQIVHTARCLNWSVDMLMQSFNGMSTDVAKGLLEYRLEITQEGYIYPKE